MVISILKTFNLVLRRLHPKRTSRVKKPVIKVKTYKVLPNLVIPDMISLLLLNLVARINSRSKMGQRNLPEELNAYNKLQTAVFTI